MVLIGFAAVAQAVEKPLKVFLLVGQSNMQGHARIQTLDHLGMDPKTQPLLEQLREPDGTPKVIEDVWISYLSAGGEKHGPLTAGFGADDTKIGPELTFGLTMQQKVGEPILLIKAAWGGKSLNTDFRPPSAGPYRFNEQQRAQFEKQGKDLKVIEAAKEEVTGHYYRLMLAQVKKVLADISAVYPNYQSSQGYQLAGFVWFQGWNDMVDRGTYPDRGEPGGYDAYSEVMAHFIRDVRKDLEAPELPFVIGVLGVGGPVSKYGPDQQRYRGIHQHFRDAMAAPASLAEFQGNVAAVRTEDFWDSQLTALRARESKARQAVRQRERDGELAKDAVRAAMEEAVAEALTPEERVILEKGVSNQEYHYLGSAKILTGIGSGFAEAMASLLKE